MRVPLILLKIVIAGKKLLEKVYIANDVTE